jgi:hypothetical protein
MRISHKVEHCLDSCHQEAKASKGTPSQATRTKLGAGGSVAVTEAQPSKVNTGFLGAGRSWGSLFIPLREILLVSPDLSKSLCPQFYSSKQNWP